MKIHGVWLMAVLSALCLPVSGRDEAREVRWERGALNLCPSGNAQPLLVADLNGDGAPDLVFAGAGACP